MADTDTPNTSDAGNGNEEPAKKKPRLSLRSPSLPSLQGREDLIPKSESAETSAPPAEKSAEAEEPKKPRMSLKLSIDKSKSEETKEESQPKAPKKKLSINLDKKQFERIGDDERINSDAFTVQPQKDPKKSAKLKISTPKEDKTKEQPQQPDAKKQSFAGTPPPIKLSEKSSAFSITKNKEKLPPTEESAEKKDEGAHPPFQIQKPDPADAKEEKKKIQLSQDTKPEEAPAITLEPSTPAAPPSPTIAVAPPDVPAIAPVSPSPSGDPKPKSDLKLKTSEKEPTKPEKSKDSGDKKKSTKDKEGDEKTGMSLVMGVFILLVVLTVLGGGGYWAVTNLLPKGDAEETVAEETTEAPKPPETPKPPEQPKEKEPEPSQETVAETPIEPEPENPKISFDNPGLATNNTSSDKPKIIKDDPISKEPKTTEETASTTTPPIPAQPPKNSDPAVMRYIEELSITAVKSSGKKAVLMMGGKVYRNNDVVDETLKVKFKGVKKQSKELIFEDSNGVHYLRDF